MTLNQYSELMHCIGELDGLCTALPENLANRACDALMVLENVINDCAKKDMKEGKRWQTVS